MFVWQVISVQAYQLGSGTEYKALHASTTDSVFSIPSPSQVTLSTVTSGTHFSITMQTSFLTLLAAALVAGTASAHTIFQQIGINGVMAARHDFMRLPHYDGPIEDVTNPAVACNGGPNPLLKISTNVANVKAGDQITLQWGHTLDSDFNSGMIIDASHNGPGTC